jgi:hypothetical protein
VGNTVPGLIYSWNIITPGYGRITYEPAPATFLAGLRSAGNKLLTESIKSGFVKVTIVIHNARESKTIPDISHAPDIIQMSDQIIF